MKIKILPSRAEGGLPAPPSKSLSHRYLICAGLAEGESLIRGIAQSEDIAATADCLRAIGAECEIGENCARVRGTGGKISARVPLPCRECGSTLRFFIPLCLTAKEKISLTGSERLLARPLEEFEKICRGRGLLFARGEREIVLQGPLTAGEYRLRGDVSSQFISGLLFALPLLSGDSRIVMEGEVESRSYIELTRNAQAEFGVFSEWTDDHTLAVSGGQRYRAAEAAVEADCSNAAFLCALGEVGHAVEVTGMNPATAQGDRVFAEYFKRLRSGAPTLSLSDCPDLGPILFALAAEKNGARFTGVRRLRLKESDRVAAMAEELGKFGVRLTVGEDEVLVPGGQIRAPREELSGHNDHRIVMALAVLCTKYGGVLSGAEAVKKSFPDFFRMLEEAGIQVQRYE